MKRTVINIIPGGFWRFSQLSCFLNPSVSPSLRCCSRNRDSTLFTKPVLTRRILFALIVFLGTPLPPFPVFRREKMALPALVHIIEEPEDDYSCTGIKQEPEKENGCINWQKHPGGESWPGKDKTCLESVQRRVSDS